jgi:hypothetical protein
VATPSGTDRSLEREGVSSPDEQTLRDRQARRWPRYQHVMDPIGRDVADRIGGLLWAEQTGTDDAS